LKRRVLGSVLALVSVSTTGCTADADPGRSAARSPAAQVSRELDRCPHTSSDARTPSRAKLEDLDVQSLVVCRATSPSTGDPNQDRYTLEKVVRAGSTAGSRVAQMLAEGEPLGSGQCQLIDSPPPVMDIVQLTDDAGDVWSVDVPHPACIGYRLAGRPALQTLPVSSAIADVLYADTPTRRRP
jgi:hypothetical protein